jgi:hypothetical protein
MMIENDWPAHLAFLSAVQILYDTLPRLFFSSGGLVTTSSMQSDPRTDLERAANQGPDQVQGMLSCRFLLGTVVLTIDVKGQIRLNPPVTAGNLLAAALPRNCKKQILTIVLMHYGLFMQKRPKVTTRPRYRL